MELNYFEIASFVTQRFTKNQIFCILVELRQSVQRLCEARVIVIKLDTGNATSFKIL